MESTLTTKCTHVLVQVAVGCFDAEGNLIGEEMFPQAEGQPLAARIFFPHDEQLQNLIEACSAQAWAKANSQMEEAHVSALPRTDAIEAGPELT